MNKLGRRLEKLGKVAVSAKNAANQSSIAFDLRSSDELPGPKSLPLLGSIFSLKPFGGDLDICNYHSFLGQIHEKYGDLARLDVFNQRQVITFKPEHAKILFANEGPAPLRPILSPWVLYAQRKKYELSLVNNQNEDWKRQRSAANPIVAKPRTIASYLDVHNNIMDEFLDVLKKKSQLDAATGSESIVVDKFENNLKFVLLEMMSIVAFDNRFRCMNADNQNSQAMMKLYEQIAKYSQLTVDLYLGLPLWKLYRTAKWKRFEEASDYIYEFCRKFVLEAYEKMRANNNKPASEAGNTMLEQFYSMEQNNKISQADIISMMSEFLLASFDTTTATLHSLLTELGRNPDVQEEIYKEVSEVFPQNGFLDADYFSKIPLLKAALKESLRLHSIAPNATRILNTDIVLDEYLIPKGTIMVVGLREMAHSEKYYKNPRQFNPKRWLKGHPQSEYIDPYTHLPFGFGARMCIGRRLAEQKIYLILSKLIKNYKIEYLGEDKPPQFRLILVPGNDLNLKFTPRSTTTTN